MLSVLFTRMKHSLTSTQIMHLLVWLLMCQLIGGIGSFFTFSSIETWYAFLEKPTLVPPNWVFGPVWTLLYLLLGISIFLVWEYCRDKKYFRVGVTLFGIQLVLNVAWSMIFFGVREPGTAFYIIFALIITAIANVSVFFTMKKSAGLIMLPYIAWIMFASYLNYSVAQLNGFF